MRKMNIIAAGLACVAIIGFVLIGCKTEAASQAPKKASALGGWTLVSDNTPGMLPDKNAQASFDAINNGDVMYNPCALLATQVVSGTNYKALCMGNDGNLYIVTWYRDLKGNSSLTSAECVDIGAYSGM
ncbi:MAG: hypothetical protein E7307_05120 [Butyrivibrio sp.]|nr:hypothetical protein [Butyrivibrio sp.]